MAWIQTTRRKYGLAYFIRDVRDGRQVVIPVPDGVDRAFAERMLDKYVVRKDLEKEGYDDGLARQTRIRVLPKRPTS